MKLHALLATLALAASTAFAADAKHTFAIGTNDFLLAGQRFQIRCGEVHAPRVPREYWRHRLQMAILTVQVENEYGFYGKDAEYMGELRQTQAVHFSLSAVTLSAFHLLP